MRIAHVTDTHFSPLSFIPQSRSIEYHAHIKQKVEAFLNQVQEYECDVICHSGDIFHLKASSRYTPEDINYYVEMFKKVNIPVFCIPGNHDLQRSDYGNYNKSAYLSFINGVGWKDISYKNINIGNIAGANINIWGLPYKPLSIFKEELEELNKQAENKEGINICLVHCDALPSDDLNLMWEIMSFGDLCKIGSNFNIFLQGHIHQSYPIYGTEENGKVQIISKPWSFMRTQKDYFTTTDILELQHVPSWTLLEILPSSTNVQYIHIPCQNFEVAFLKDSLVKQLQDNEKVKSFLDNVKKQYGSDNPFQIVNADDMMEGIKANISKEVLEIINEYLG